MISGIILTRNEEANISDAIQSIAPVVDEIIIADSGSTDNTIAIASQFNTRIINIDWQGWVQIRNHIVKEAKHQMILFMDADERLDQTLQHAITVERKKGFPHQVYLLSRLNFIQNTPIRYGAWNPDNKIRLYHKGTVIWKGGSVHEKADAGNIKPFLLAGNLLHYSFKSRAELFNKSRKYASLASEDLQTRSSFYLLFKSIFSPPVRFFRDYFLKLGFMDGLNGFLIACAAFKEVFLKYSLALKKD